MKNSGANRSIILFKKKKTKQNKNKNKKQKTKNKILPISCSFIHVKLGDVDSNGQSPRREKDNYSSTLMTN